MVAKRHALRKEGAELTATPVDIVQAADQRNFRPSR